MHPYRTALHLSIVVVLAVLASLASTSLAAAQQYGPQQYGPQQQGGQQMQGSPQVLYVNPVAPAVAGNVTFHGIAVDCTTGQPATRVAVYDGAQGGGAYVADVSMDTTVNIGRICGGPTANMRAGFTLIYDTHNLNDGPHTLSFTAEYPNGATASIAGNVFIDNQSAYGTPYNRSYYYPSYQTYPIYPDYSTSPNYANYPGYDYFGDGGNAPYPDYNAYPSNPGYAYGSASYQSPMPGYFYGCGYGPYQRADAPRTGCVPGGIQPYDVTYGPYGPTLTPDTNDPYIDPWNVTVPCQLCLNPNPGQ